MVNVIDPVQLIWAITAFITAITKLMKAVKSK